MQRHVPYRSPISTAPARRRFAGCATVSAVAGLAFAGLVGLSAARAAAPCASEPNRALFELEALKSELMVLATDCHDHDQYNAFVQRYQAQLADTEHALDSYFKRAYGKRAQQARDAYVTSLANAQAHLAHAVGQDFCPRNGQLFHEVLALRGPTDLPAFAAGQDLVPSDLGACSAAPEPSAPVRGTRGHRKPAR